MTKHLIAVTDTIDASIGGVDVSFYGDPPEDALIALYTIADKQGLSPVQTLELVTELRSLIPKLIVPTSRDAWQRLEDEGKIGTQVVMVVFSTLAEAYAAALGFRRGLPSTSSDGQPDTAPTSLG